MPPPTLPSALPARSSLPAPGRMLGDLESPGQARLVLRGMALSLVLLTGWAAVARIDQVTRAPAQLIVAARTQLIQSADGGIVTQLHVREGDPVKAGQALATLQNERAEAAVADSRAKVAALRITLARLQAEVYGTRLHFAPDLLPYREYIRNQTSLYEKRQTAYREDVRALENILRLAQSELSINHALEGSGDVSRAEILRLQRSVADITAQLTSKRNKYFQDAQAEMTRAQEELSTQSEQLRERSQLLQHTELVAPMDGVVNNIRVNTVGGVVHQGDTVLELLPNTDQLLVEARVSPAEIAFIAPGQAASIKLDAYDSSIFGALRGEVSYISPDVVTEDSRQGTISYYRVRIRVTGSELQTETGREIHLRPGLTASVDIKAMERSVLSYLLKPIVKTLDNALGER